MWLTTSSYPTGWLRADGSAISRTTYGDLYAICGTTYGTGDGLTTFNLPNMAQAGTGSPIHIIKATMSGSVEPSTVAHASSHARGGADVIDGDRVQVDYVPTRYARDSSDANAGANTDVTAHLKGIDNSFNSLRRLAYQTRTSSYTTATSTPASAAKAFSSDLTFTSDGSSLYLIEFYCSRLQTSAVINDFIAACLFDVTGGVSLGHFGMVQTPVANNSSAPLLGRIWITPAAGSRSYNTVITHGSNAGTAYAAALGGTAGSSPIPMFMSIYGPGIV
jgi:hypothetical protein